MKKILLFLLCMSTTIFGADDVLHKGIEKGRWTTDIEAAKAFAKKNKKFTLLKFTGKDWCPPCKMMEKTVFSTAIWQSYASDNLALVFLDMPRSATKFTPEKIMARNRLLTKQFKVRGFPTMVLLSSDGKEVARFSTHSDAQKLIDALVKHTGLSAPESAIKIPLTGDRAAQLREIYQNVLALNEEDYKKSFKEQFNRMLSIWKTDPILLASLPPELLKKILADGNLSNLNRLAQAIKSTEKTGAPLDAIFVVLQNEKSPLFIRRSQIQLLVSCDHTEAASKLIPAVKELKVVKSIDAIKSWAQLLAKHDRTDNAIELLLENIIAVEQEKDLQILSTTILSFAEAINDQQAASLIEICQEKAPLLKTIKDRLASNSQKALKERDFDHRRKLLEFNRRFINAICQSQNDTTLARMLIRHWQFELANTHQKYRQQNNSRNQQFISLKELLDITPSSKTLGSLPLDEENLFKLQLMQTKLRLGIFDAKALDNFIALKKQFPDTVSKGLVEFMTDWAKVNNPQVPIQQNNQNQYRREPPAPIQGAISITRSRQMSNLKDLGKIVKICRENAIFLPPKKIVTALISCFSPAELPTAKDLALVFPAEEAISNEILLSLSDHIEQKIKANFTNKKQSVNIQGRFVTNRQEGDIDKVTSKALLNLVDLLKQSRSQTDSSIELRLKLARLSFKTAEFNNKHNFSTFDEYISLRDEALAIYKECWQEYIDDYKKGTIPASAEILSSWFNCILGAADLNTLETVKVSQPVQMLELRDLLKGLEGEVGLKHRQLLGKALNKAWDQGIPPHLKQTFLNACNSILPQEASIETLEKYTDLYREILKEVALVAVIDGSSAVGVGKDFGLFLQLQHSPELATSSGGFTKYLKTDHLNYSISREPINYREKFEKHIRSSFSDKFTINSITWVPDNIKPMANGNSEITPIAYVSLQANSATVDRLPPIQIDLDFLDGKGSVVLPCLSDIQILNSQKYDTRKLDNPHIEMILDDRKADKGEINLEILMNGNGILPKIEDLLIASDNYKFPEEIDTVAIIKHIEQQGSKLLTHAESTAVVKLIWKDSAKGQTFIFPQVKDKRFQVHYKRYQDVDQIECESQVKLNAAPKGQGNNLLATLAWLVGIIAVLATLIIFSRRNGTGVNNGQQAKLKFGNADNISAVSCLNYLKELQRIETDEAKRLQLEEVIAEIEVAYFSLDGKKDMNLRLIVQEWERQCNA